VLKPPSDQVSLHILPFPLHMLNAAIGDSDFLTIHNAFSSWRKASVNGSFVRKFCRVNYISHQVSSNSTGMKVANAT